ncbi:hypothetical protein GCM10011371_15570 [Novosphingobium marinum]|uniref:UPF0235 protein FHS75_001999 n=1 Tax=Novosphingobium marinum TaxID=1514948 RepID=A0A7Y9XYG3_9SPHN|nr:DUF167 domain-containing protein [Novosphingobium marinum]NYH95670.1 hypothetical protein [Novosphingobium marinum]GGC28910.1 hypothetical protein GCM10011371_15570 [Novosphingobium marinum]
MARPPLTLPEPAEIRALIDGEGRLAVRVTPGARGVGLEIGSGGLKAKVREKPQDGKATAAVIALVAEALGIAPSQVELLRGATSRDKHFRVML